MTVYTVRRTDCGTGWQVVQGRKVIFTSRNRQSIIDLARDLNASKNEDDV